MKAESNCSEQYSLFFQAQQKSHTAFRKINHIMKSHKQSLTKISNKAIQDISSQNMKNMNIPHYLLDEDRNIKSVIDIFEYLFPDVEKYTELEKQSELVKLIGVEFIKPDSQIYTTKREIPLQLQMQDLRMSKLKEEKKLRREELLAKVKAQNEF
ncbi:hypothetical protein SS50377_22596 [Spironucleus salmonicida]|uniref:Uncharacterized protein n=1 Tax=Spironucleus salmonicida TaxID=348837 RepID=V6LBQ4_9EUKA|nr:hypothetical protein SS50377_22596 [Spironucleus salmonicida]|eukprot:EST41915.1 Hypothetical protein SS50377_18219 [Spironucleus salmonicida]